MSTAPAEAEDDDCPDVLAYTVYEWECGCQWVNHEEADPQGEVVTCAGCGAKSRVYESR